MYFKDLRSIVQNNLGTLDTIKSNLNEVIEIEEKQKSTLKKVFIKNMPTKNIWLFENEEADTVFTSNGNKVEKTILYFQENKLYIIMIELKQTMNCDKLKDTQKKIQDSLSFISIFLLVNQHKDKIYENMKIVPIGILCFNKNSFLNANISKNKEICRKMKDNISTENLNEKFTIEIETSSLGNIKIPFKAFQNPNQNSDNFSINFKELIN